MENEIVVSSKFYLLVNISFRNLVFQLTIAANHPKIWPLKTLIIYYPSFSVDQELGIQLSDLALGLRFAVRCWMELKHQGARERGPGQGIIPPFSSRALPCLHELVWAPHNSVLTKVRQFT